MINKFSIISQLGYVNEFIWYGSSFTLIISKIIKIYIFFLKMNDFDDITFTIKINKIVLNIYYQIFSSNLLYIIFTFIFLLLAFDY